MMAASRQAVQYLLQSAIRHGTFTRLLDPCSSCRFSPVMALPRQESVRLYSIDNVQGVQGKIAGIDDHDTAENDGTRVPEGIQGYECADFKLWLESCRRYGLHNCDDQVENLREGRKTLAQVLREQDELIQKIANEYKARVRETEEVLRRDPAVQGIQGSNQQALELLARDDPCPQGVQGENCARFRLWLQNCGRFGFHGCDEQLENYRAGRKTLKDIFREQDELIKSVAKHYSTSADISRDEVSSSNPTQTSNTTTTATPENLTQRQKLKRAIKDYGSTVVVFHIGISLLSLGGFYVAVSSGLDVVGLLSWMGVGQSILESRLATGASTFVVAYAVHKVFAPVRIGITLTCTPIIVHRLRRIGFLKTPKS